MCVRLNHFYLGLCPCKCCSNYRTWSNFKTNGFDFSE